MSCSAPEDYVRLMALILSFCGARAPGDPPVEVRIGLRSERRIVLPVVEFRPDGADTSNGTGDPPALRQPRVALAVLATLLESDGTPLQAAEIEARVNAGDRFSEVSLSSVEKTLCDLARLRLVRNERGRGYLPAV